MTTFDFHNLLFPTEFENLCRDILEIREEDITFTTYKSGRDGGTDLKSTNTKEKIIGQCKLYNPNNYRGLLSALKREVKKGHKQQPGRYIVCVNLEMTPNRILEIKKLFGNYIKSEEDIIDGIKLNKYLNQKAVNKLYNKILKYTPTKKVRDLISQEEITIFEIKLSDFINNNKNCNLIKDIGIISYVNSIIEKLKNISINS